MWKPMSFVDSGKRIVCDGVRCGAISSVPVALRPTLSSPNHNVHVAKGWLFISTKNGFRHYCPDCATAYLMRERDEIRP